MTKKRKFYFTYAESNEEEKHIIKKEFNEMLGKIFFKFGKTFMDLIFHNTIIIILILSLYYTESEKIKLIILSLLIIIVPLYLLTLYRIGKR